MNEKNSEVFKINENNNEKFENLLDFIEQEYFQILERLDRVSADNISKTETMLGVDFQELRLYIDSKIPALLEKIRELILKNKNFRFANFNSLRDILGNSILNILNRIVWVAENYASDDERVRNKIFSRKSLTRKTINDYVERENIGNFATYYIDELCDDENKLLAELSSEEGYLKKFEKFFLLKRRNDKKECRYFPTGGKKLPYFKFFSRFEKGCFKKDDISEELKKLEDDILNKEKILSLYY